jgi:hypothetical protein
MDAQEAETAYGLVKSQLDSGKVSLDEYNRRVSELRYQDNTGMWWAISPTDGSWLKWNGSAWVPAFAQVVPAMPQAPVQPAPQPSIQQPAVQQPVQKEAAKPSWYIPPVSSQQKPAAAQPATAQPMEQPVQQPVSAQPVQQPATSSYYIPPVGTVQQAGVQQPATAVVQPAAAVAVKPARNWAGIGSLVLGILSWLFYPYILGIAAVVIGGYSVYITKKVKGKIAFVAIVGILLGLASIVTDNFYFILFPPTQGTLLTFWLLP